jgi:hypothetical protein
LARKAVLLVCSLGSASAGELALKVPAALSSARSRQPLTALLRVCVEASIGVCALVDDYGSRRERCQERVPPSAFSRLEFGAPVLPGQATGLRSGRGVAFSSTSAQRVRIVRQPQLGDPGDSGRSTSLGLRLRLLLKGEARV